jgi:ribosomal small subunit protein bTHX
MGKGDKKSKKGKRWRNSYGVSRNRNAIKARLKRSASKKVKVELEAAAAKPRRVAKKKAEA